MKQELFDNSWNPCVGCTQKDANGNRLPCADGCHQYARAFRFAERKPCANCGGTGEVEPIFGSDRKCFRCQGKGKLLADPKGFFAPTFHPERLGQPLKWGPVKTDEDCLDCAGGGWFRDALSIKSGTRGIKCPSCRGTGKRRRRRVIMCCIAGELFSDEITNCELLSVFHAIIGAQQHTYLIPTKRWRRMADFLVTIHPIDCVYLLPSACNQAMLDEAAPHILRLCEAGWPVVPLIEPMLGPVDVGKVLPFTCSRCQADWQEVGGHRDCEACVDKGKAPVYQDGFKHERCMAERHMLWHLCLDQRAWGYEESRQGEREGDDGKE